VTRPPNKKQLSKIQRQKAELRASLWPGLDDKRLWSYQTSVGWLNVPRAMPLILRIMDNMSKGKPLSSTYFDLWCRTFNDSFVVANKPREMAFYAGFSGERAERTWASRIAILQKLGFIEIKPGASGPTHYILILNPFLVMKYNYEKKMIDEQSFHALLERMSETGGTEFQDTAEDADVITVSSESP
jgi:hypothetical protein